MTARAGALAALFVVGGALIQAQAPHGYVSVGVDALPNAPVEATEMRARIFAEHTARPSDLITLHVAGYVDGLAADRQGGVAAAIVRVHDAYIELSGNRADLRVGYSRIVWGRLDEVQPGDVVNPLDIARYLFEGRSEARLPVALARGRLFFGERATVEGVLVPDFRRGRFDQLDERSSPFNLERGGRAVGDGPKTSIRNVQGGGRASFTTGRVDWSAAVFRGFRPFPEYQVLPAAGQPRPGDPLVDAPVARRVFPRFTMVAGDFETATGAWAWRGEAAFFWDDGSCGADPCGCGARPCGPRIDAGLGFDRRTGGYHLSGSVLLRRAPGFITTSLVGVAERTFARERYRTRAFALVNLDDRAAFIRSITTMEVRRNVSLEGSVGWFFGEGEDDPIARFGDRDFLYARLRVFF